MAHPKDAIHPCGQIRRVRDEHECEPIALNEALQESDHPLTGVLIEVAGRLVREDEPRFVRDRTRNGHALLLPAGETIGERIRAVSEADFSTEYNDYVLNVRVVDGVEQAISHIAQYGSAHSDSIVTRNEATAHRFLAEVDSATVYWNASTRFTDGGEFGFGAEIGISTDKLHARGPMALEELTTYKYVLRGTGQVRS